MTLLAERPDNERMRAAFLELRACGYWARADQADGLDAVPQDVIKRAGKFVVWDARETPVAFDAGGWLVRTLHLHHFERDADEIARLLQQHGLDAEVVPGAAPHVLVHPMPGFDCDEET